LFVVGCNCWYGIGSYKLDNGIGSSSTEISEMERSPKLISDNIDQLSALVALLSLEKTEPEVDWYQSRVYGLEFLSSSPHDGIRDRIERTDKNEDVVLMEAPSVVLLECGMVLEIVLADEAIATGLVPSDELGCRVIRSRSCTAISLFDFEIFPHIFSTSSCRLVSCCEASFVELLKNNDKPEISAWSSS